MMRRHALSILIWLLGVNPLAYTRSNDYDHNLLRLPDHVRSALAASVPFPKRLGQPDEYAALAEFMITTAYLNAECVRLDGGIRMAPR